MRIVNPDFQTELQTAIDNDEPSRRHLSSDKLVRAEADVVQKKAALAKIMLRMINSGQDPYSSPAMMKAKKDFDSAAGHYCREIFERNKHLKDNNKLIPNASLLKCPTKTKLNEILERHPIRKSVDERTLPPLPLIGERVDSNKIPKQGPEGEPISISESQAGGLFAAELLTQLVPYIDQALLENKPLPEADKFIAAQLRSLMNANGQLESGDITLPVETEIHSMMLHRSRELFEEQIRIEFKLGHSHVHADNVYLPPLTGPQLKTQTDALKTLELPSAESNGVSISELQKKLAKFGRDDPKVIAFLQASGLTKGAQERLRNLAGSQHDMEEYAREENLRRKPLNVNRLEGKGTAGEVKTAMEELQRAQQGNDRIRDLPPGFDKSSGSTAAAIYAAKSVLDEKNDLTSPDGLKEKISKPVEDSLKKDDKLASPAAKAAQTGAEQGVKLAEEHLAQSDDAKFSVTMAGDSLLISNNLFGMNDDKFIAETKFDGLDLSEVGIEVAKLAKNNPHCLQLIKSKEYIKAKGFVAKTTSLAQASFNTLRKFDVPPAHAKSVTDRLVKHFLQKGSVSPDEIEDQISKYAQSDDCKEEANKKKLLSASKDVQQSVQMSQKIATGVEKIKETSLAVKKTNAQSLKEVALSDVLAQRMSDKIHSAHEGKALSDDEVKSVVKREIERANHIMAKISNVDDYKDDDGFKWAPETIGGEPFKKLLLKITNSYKVNGEISKEGVIQILTANWKDPKPNESEAGTIATYADRIIQKKKDAATEFDLSPFALISVNPAENEPKIDAPSDIVINGLGITSAYANIAHKSVQEGARAVMKEAGLSDSDIKKVVAEIDKGQKEGKSSEEVAFAIAKAMPPGSDFVTLMSVVALIAKGDEQEQILRKMYAHAQPRLFKSTYAAMGAGIASTAVKAGIPDFIAVPMSKLILRGSMKDEDVQTLTNHAVDRVNGAEKVYSLASDLKNLGLVDGQITPAMHADIKDKLVTVYLQTGNIDGLKAQNIVNQVIKVENTKVEAEAKKVKKPVEVIMNSVGCPTFDNIGAYDPPQALAVIDPATAKASLSREAYKAYVLAASSKARIDAEKAHPDKVKDSKSNFREVAAAVVATAIASGCDQEQALALAKKLTAHYVEKGNFDDMDLTAFAKEIKAVAPDLDDAQIEKAAKLVSRGAKAASKLPELKDADPVAAGTRIAADVYPDLSDPKEAGAIAAAIAEARNGSPKDIENASLYAQSICEKVTSSSAPLVYAAVGAIAVHHQVQRESKRFIGEHLDERASWGVALSAQESIGHIDSSAFFGEHPRTFAMQAMDNVTGIRAFRDGLEGDDEKEQAKVLRVLAKASTISVQVGVVALKLGLSVADAEKVALEMATPHIMARGGETFQSAVEISLAHSRVEKCLQIVRDINGVTPIANLNTRLGAAVQPPVVFPGGPLTEAQVTAFANQNYKTAKVSFLGSKSPTPAEKAAAEIAGKLAAAKVYQQALKTGVFTSPAELAKVARKAKSLAESAATTLAGFRKDFIARNPAHRNTIAEVPRAISKESVAELAVAARIGDLIDEGLSRAKNFDKDVDPGIDRNDRAYQAECAAAAVEEMLITAGFSPDEAKEAGERARKAVENSSNPAEAGALAASLVKPERRDISQAVAAVVADIASPPQPARGTDVEIAQHAKDKSQAIAQAVRVAAIGEDRALPSRPLTDEEINNKKRWLEARIAALNEEERQNMTHDKFGVNDALTNAHLEGGKLDAFNAGDWKITLPSYGVGTEAKSLKDIPEMKHFAEALKSCDGYVTEATLREAVEKFNLTSSKKLSVTDQGDNVHVSFKGLSMGEIKQLMQAFVDCSAAAKAAAQSNQNKHAQALTRSDSAPSISK